MQQGFFVAGSGYRFRRTGARDVKSYLVAVCPVPWYSRAGEVLSQVGLYQVLLIAACTHHVSIS